MDELALEIWAYDVPDTQVLMQWLGYRGLDRSRPLIGDRRKPSPLGDIQTDTWLPENTTEQLNVLDGLGYFVALDPTVPHHICAAAETPAETVEAMAVAPNPPKASVLNQKFASSR